MDRRLLIGAIGKYIFGVLLLFLLLFIPAGTLNYWNARLFMVILFIPMFIVGMILMVTNPELLRKRLKSKEKETEQKSVILLGGLMFICGFVVAGLDYRFDWFILPKWLVILAAVIFIIAYLIYVEVLRENSYLSRTIEIQEDQKVIDTGLYGIIRHPMYSSTILLFLSMPLVLGSFFSFIIFLPYPAIVIKRIKNEEQVLERGLAGYTEYKKRVKYRLFPFIW